MKSFGAVAVVAALLTGQTCARPLGRGACRTRTAVATATAPAVVNPGSFYTNISIPTSPPSNTTSSPTGWPAPYPYTNTSTPSPLPVPSNGTGVLQLALTNNMGGESVNAYVTGTDSNNKLVILQPNGQWYYPDAAGSQIPINVTTDVAIPLGAQGSTTYISLPSYISAGRIWFAEGELKFAAVQGGTGATALVEPSAIDPSDSNHDINWGFVELTYTQEAGLWANLSYVDFVGLVLGMFLQTSDGKTQATPGLQPGAVKAICADLTNQTSVDGQPWNELCISDSRGEPLRVLSPSNYVQLNSDAFNNYWTDYIDQVWSHYASNPLTIDTQSSSGKVSCTVQGDLLTCDGDSQGFTRPTPSDIFGCNSGPFAISASDNNVRRAAVPRLCAAFNRSTFLLAGGDVQPSLPESDYYTIDATNHYSKIVHQHEEKGVGYAFSYDDVTPSDGTPQSGELVSTSPQMLIITVGGTSN